MYRKKPVAVTTMEINDSTEGETIETKIERITTNNEPITDGAPIIYMERKDGVQAGYDIRTDRFEVAVEAMDYVTKSKISARENGGKIIKMEKEKGENSGNPESIQGTE